MQQIEKAFADAIRSHPENAIGLAATIASGIIGFVGGILLQTWNKSGRIQITKISDYKRECKSAPASTVMDQFCYECALRILNTYPVEKSFELSGLPWPIATPLRLLSWKAVTRESSANQNNSRTIVSTLCTFPATRF